MNAADNRDPGLPPQNMEAEQAVLGACLLDRDVIARLAAQLTDRDFARPAHAVIWRAIVALYQLRQPPDLMLVATELRHRQQLDDAGGETYLAELLCATPTAAHANYYAALVRESAVRRGLVGAAQRIATVAYDRTIPLADVISRSGEALQDAARARMREGYRSMAEVMAALYDGLEVREPPLPLGLHDLDRLIGGVGRGQLVLLAARPSIGKSALAIQSATRVAGNGEPVGFVSLEMSVEEIADRMIGFTAGVNMHAARTGGAMTDVQLGRITKAAGPLSGLPLFIDDRSDGTLADVLGRARALFAETGTRILIVDYLQLMSAGGGKRPGNRTEEVSMVSRALKTLARELSITVLALSQLSRATETRSDPTPQLSDLRDSGSLEQDADMVIFIHRPDRYSDKAEKNVAQLIVAKHRMGPIGTVMMGFDAEHSQFTDYRWGEY